MKSLGLLTLPSAALAFSSVPADRFRPPVSPNFPDAPDKGSSGPNAPRTAASAAADAVSSPWRIVLDLGREPLARMPSDWARSGCRLPLAIPTDFAASGGDGSAKNALVPRSETVSFTGPGGAVVRPISGEGWELSKDEKEITFSYTVPERMERRDVYVDAGTELVLAGRVYTQKELDLLNGRYYEARERLWKAGGEIGDIYDRRAASKKWDEGSGRWVRRYENENPLRVAQKQLAYWGAKADERRKMAERPDLKDLSERGTLPGVEGGVHFARGGTVRAGRGGPVCGTWSAMPITGAPASYRS